MERDVHGGGCCGISHIYGFGHQPNDPNAPAGRRGGGGDAADLDARIEEFKRSHGGHADRKGLVEVVLTDTQMTRWAGAMKERGFRLVTRFFNSNSGNHCNVLHKTFGNTRGANRPARPFEW